MRVVNLDCNERRVLGATENNAQFFGYFVFLMIT